MTLQGFLTDFVRGRLWKRSLSKAREPLTKQKPASQAKVQSLVQEAAKLTQANRPHEAAGRLNEALQSLTEKGKGRKV